MATQTLIQLKYSTANSVPVSLSTSEPAYSFVSEKLFIGTDTSSVVAIGGQFYTRLLDANTSYAFPNTLVTRDSVGSSDFNDIQANTVNANTTIYAGLNASPPLPGATNPIIGAGGNANNYVQSYIRNINSGGSASADFIAYSDNGSDVSGWVDMGITSSTFNDSKFTITGPEEGYIFMSATNGSSTSGNLVIATDSTGVYNDIVFHTGSFTDKNSRIAYFRNGQGLVIDATTPSLSNSTGALVVNGGIGVKDGLYADQLYDFNSRVLTTVVPVSGGGVTLSQSKTGNTVTLTVNNTGVHSLTANTNQVTANGTTGNIVFGLATTSVTPGIYGGPNQVPSFTVDSFGRLTQAGNVAISTSFNLNGNTGTDVFNTGDTLTLIGNGTGIVTTVSDNTYTFATDTTVLRSNTTTVGPQTIQTDLTITGNLVVRGEQVISNTTIVQSEDSLIKLAANNVTDAIDIGFYGQYGSAGIKYAGLFRKSADKFYLFKDVTQDPISNNVTFTSTNRATLDANITGGTVSGLSSVIAISDGGTNNNTFTTGSLLQFDGTRFVSQANTGTAGTYGSNSHIPVITTDNYGRVSGVSNTAITIDASAITTGILDVDNGGTGSASFSANGVVVSGITSTSPLTALTGSAYQVLQLNSSGIPIFSGLNGGTF